MLARPGRVLAALVLALAPGLGCKKRHKTEPPGPQVKKVKIEGAKEVPEPTVLEHIELHPSSAFGEKSYYTPGIEVSDRERIGQLYEAHGHYDAEVAPIEVEVVHPKRKLEHQRAKVKISIAEGPGTVVEDARWVWGPSIDHGHPVDRTSVVKAAGLAAGDKFTIPGLNAASAAAQAAVREQGFAFASVVESAEVDRTTRTARIVFEVEPGERFTISRIDVVGLQRVPEKLVRRELGRVEGRTYSPTLLTQIEGTINGMRAFSAVSAKPGDKTGPGQLALVLRLRERRMQEVGFGLVIDVDPVQWSQRAGVRYQHGNLFRNLTRFEMVALGGYSELPNPVDLQAHGPRAELDFTFSKRGLLERKLVWTLEPSAQIDIREGFQAWGVENRMGVSRFLGRIASLGLTYNNRYMDFFNLVPGLRGELESLGIQLKDPYVASWFELQAELFSLDAILNPKRGVRLLATYQFANRYIGSQFDYQLVQPELRGYYDPHPRVRLAARTRVGFIFPYADSNSAPIDLRFYLGGVSDVRGWPLRHISPRFNLCGVDGTDTCQAIPIGGNTEVLGNLEMRIGITRAFWLAVFGDAGDVQARTATIRPEDWVYTTGGGVRYDTPIGPLRLDIGGQINTSDRFVEPRRWAIHFSFGEAF